MRELRQRKWQTSLGAVLGVVAGATGCVVAWAAFAAWGHTEQALLASSGLQREREAGRVRLEVERFLDVANSVAERVSRGVVSGAIPADAAASIEGALFNELVSNPLLDEVTFTRSTVTGYDAEGQPELGTHRWELSLIRGPSTLLSRRTFAEKGECLEFRAAERAIESQRYTAGDWLPSGPASDPGQNPTFLVSASQRHQGLPIWSDLHYSNLDAAGAKQHVVLTLQRSLRLSPHEVAVLRVGIATQTLDSIVQQSSCESADANLSAKCQVALLAVSDADSEPAHLVARVAASDAIVEVAGELRVHSSQAPPVIQALLQSELVRGLDPDAADRDGVLLVGQERYLATLRHLELGAGGTAGWLVAVLVPEAYYTRDLLVLIRQLAYIFALAVCVIVLAASGAVFALKRGLGRATSAMRRMQRFDFAPSNSSSMLTELDEVLVGLERAKTVARAMGKYVPLQLVKGFYERNQEPELGGQEAEVTVLFSDIAGFTSLAEALPAQHLALALGSYLEEVTSAIESKSGVIDKYIGDAVMALWNAPVMLANTAELANPAEQACAAVLDAMQRLATLYASPRWAGLPALRSRFGVHTASMLVGNFGAPSRLSYTVIGDGVNLAARLEPLCKQYGVEVLASEATVRQAEQGFQFRCVDRVAVKGKSQGVLIYELLGSKPFVVSPLIANYEAALAAYFNRDFSSALSKLSDCNADGPSRVLRARCLEFIENAPAADWDGTYFAKTK